MSSLLVPSGSFPSLVIPPGPFWHLLVTQIDYATGFLGAYGAILALIDRQLAYKEGRRWGGVVVYASLCQTATWMAKLGAACPSVFSYISRVTKLLFTSDSKAVTVEVRHLPPPAATCPDLPPPAAICRNLPRSAACSLPLPAGTC